MLSRPHSRVRAGQHPADYSVDIAHENDGKSPVAGK